MSNLDVVRAWKDEDYRNSLSEDQRALLPNNPAGLLELEVQELEAVGGLTLGGTCDISTFACCPNPQTFVGCNSLIRCGGTLPILTLGCC